MSRSHSNWRQTRALLWREWRARRAELLALWALNVAAVWAWTGIGDWRPLRNMPISLFWCLVMVVAVAPVYAGERAAGTDRFLGALPLSRRRLWRIKLACAVLLALVAIGPSWLVCVLSISPHGWPAYWLDSGVEGGPSVLVYLAGYPLACFAAGVLASVVADSVVTAVALGGVLLMAVIGYVGWGLWWLAHVPVGFTMCLSAGAMLAASRAVACGRRV